MALTDDQKSQWLSNDYHRIVIMDLGYHDGTSKSTLFLSSDPYIMIQGDTPWSDYTGTLQENLIYDDIISNVSNITSRIDSDSTIGNIDLINSDGEYDYLLNDITVVGHSIKLYIGDSNWPRANFIKIFEGIVSAISSSSPENISITIKDKKESLDVPLQTELIIKDGYWADLIEKIENEVTTFTGTITYKTSPDGVTPIVTEELSYDANRAVLPEATENTPVPICLGKCFNIEPVLIDSYNHVYLIHDQGIVDAPEVRSNGVALAPDQYEVDTTIGLLRLLDHDQGTQITCDVVGNNVPSDRRTGPTLEPYSIADILEWILLEKGNVLNSDICYNTFDPLGSNTFGNIDTLGFFSKTETTVLTEVTKLINSVGGFLRFTSTDCKLQIYRLEDPIFSSTADLTINPDDIIVNGISIISIEEPKKSITLGYKKNWLPNGTLATSITDAESQYYNIDKLNSFNNEFSTVYSLTSIDTNNEYPLAEDVELIETTIYTKVAANTELARRIDLRSKRRRVMRINSTATSFTYNIGDIASINHSRFGLEGGKFGMIIGLEESPTNNRVILDVWL